MLGSQTTYKINISNLTNTVGINTTFSQQVLFLNKDKFGYTRTQWVANHPDLVLQIEYAMPSPELTPFTSEQKTVYDSILSGGTYEVVTTMSTEATLSPDIEAIYVKDLASTYEAIEDKIEEILG